MDGGHCDLPAEELEPFAVALPEVPVESVQTALNLVLAEGTVVVDTVAGTSCMFLGGLHRTERAIGERFLEIACGKFPRVEDNCRLRLAWP